MDVRALLFDVNGTLIDIETDEWMDQCYRAIAHYLTYQGINLHRGEVRDLYFQIMKEQFAASSEKYPEFDVVGVWREALRRCGTDYTRSLPPETLRQMPLFLAQMQRGISRKKLVAFPQTQEILAQLKTRHRLGVVSELVTFAECNHEFDAAPSYGAAVVAHIDVFLRRVLQEPALAAEIAQYSMFR